MSVIVGTAGSSVIVGLDDSGGNLVQVLWLTTGEEEVRNQKLVEKRGDVFVEPIDPSTSADPALLYRAMRVVTCRDDYGELYSIHIVGDSSDVDIVAEGYLKEHGFYRTIRKRAQEEAEDFVCRIVACSHWYPVSFADIVPVIRTAKLRSFSGVSNCTMSDLNILERGSGYYFSSYSIPPNNIPADGDIRALNGDARQIAEEYWENLDPQYRIAIAVRFIPQVGPWATFIINESSKVA